MDIRVLFGKAMRKHRLELGLSQESFALSIDMDRTYVASVEQGKRNLSLINIQKIADGLGISMSELFASIERLSSESKGASL